MIQFEATSGLGELIGALSRLADMDLRPLADEIADIVHVDNAAARLDGLDRNDQPFAPVKPRAGRYKGLTGPPLAPRGSASRIVSGFEVEVVPLADGAYEVLGSWPSFPELQYHVSGTRHMPARDPAGVTPSGREAIEAAVREFVAEHLGLF